ncbi:hypothetical protein Tco_0290257, partial [Tanacetum coccineum]
SIAVVIGKDLAQICSSEYDTVTCIFLGIQAELSTIASDLTMIMIVLLADKLALEKHTQNRILSQEVRGHGVPNNDWLLERVKDIEVEQSIIFKEVEDYLKTYSSSEMDMRWYVEGIL